VLAVYTLAVYGGIGIGPLFLTILPEGGQPRTVPEPVIEEEAGVAQVDK